MFMLLVNFVHVRTSESVFIVELCIFAAKNLSTRGNHLWCECELLAVELKGVTVVFQVVFSVLTRLSRLDELLVNLTEVDANLLHVFIGIFVVGTNCFVLVCDPVVNFLDVVGEVHDRLFEGFKGDKHLSLDLDALLVIVLVPNCAISAEG